MIRATLSGLAFAIAAAVTVTTTRFGGGVAYLWIANAILVAHLTLLSRREWAAPALGAMVGSALVTSTLGIGPAGALPVSLLNITEALFVATLLRRYLGPRQMQCQSVEQLFGLLFAALGSAAFTGCGAAAVIGWASGTSFWLNWLNWTAGHALGVVTFAPVARMVIDGELSRCLLEANRRERAKMAALVALVVGTTLLVFAQARLPLLFLPMLPVILITFRLGQLGASLSVMLVALIGGWFTLHDNGPVQFVAAGLGGRVQFFQFYLAVTVLTALPVAADLTRRRHLFEQLRDSEARYRLLTDNSTDIIMNLNIVGCIRFVSPSVRQLSGFTPAALEGTQAIELVVEEDRAAVRAAHRDAIAHPDRTVIVEYRAQLNDGTIGWFETHTRAVHDEHGTVTGAVAAIRDIGHRKSLEAELSLAATTDPLTGLANRRAFDAELEQLATAVEAGERASCVAIFDIDHFKQVNDRFGHEVGDRVLEAFAAAARRQVRDRDLVARLGGEEFGIILTGAEADQAQRVCERIRLAICRAPFRVGDHLVSVTVSAGIATLDGSRPVDAVLRAADEALYRAKRTGRNRLDLAA